MLDVVNDMDEVIGKVAYEEVYKKLLFHRIVHILIFNTQGKLALQKRSKTKEYLPGYWSTSVGGHVQSGESYEEAALREYEEELGTTTPLKLIFKDAFQNEDDKHMKFIATFSTQYNGPFMANPEEVEYVEYFSLGEIKKMIQNGDKFHPELLYILKRHALTT